MTQLTTSLLHRAEHAEKRCQEMGHDMYWSALAYGFREALGEAAHAANLGGIVGVTEANAEIARLREQLDLAHRALLEVGPGVQEHRPVGVRIGPPRHGR